MQVGAKRTSGASRRSATGTSVDEEGIELDLNSDEDQDAAAVVDKDEQYNNWVMRLDSQKFASGKADRRTFHQACLVLFCWGDAFRVLGLRRFVSSNSQQLPLAKTSQHILRQNA